MSDLLNEIRDLDPTVDWGVASEREWDESCKDWFRTWSRKKVRFKRLKNTGTDRLRWIKIYDSGRVIVGITARSSGYGETWWQAWSHEVRTMNRIKQLLASNVDDRTVEGMATTRSVLHTVLDGSVIAFFRDLPDGTRYYTERNFRDDSGASPHTKGQGADDTQMTKYGHDMLVMVDSWPEPEEES